MFPNPYRGAGRRLVESCPTTSVSEAIMRAIAKAKVKPGTPHDLRHIAARWLVRHRASPVNRRPGCFGHADLKTTQRYLTMDGRDMAGMFDAIGLREKRGLVFLRVPCRILVTQSFMAFEMLTYTSAASSALLRDSTLRPPKKPL